MKKKIALFSASFLIAIAAYSQSFNLPAGYDRVNQHLEVPHAPASQKILSKGSPSVRSVAFSEGFDDISLLPGNGWSFINNSSPLGLNGWFQGNDAVFTSQSGGSTSYIGANFNNTAAIGTISNWLITPEIVMSDGNVIKFWTRAPAGTNFPDRLEVRMSTNGSSTNVGTLATDVGDFSTLLLSVNPTLAIGGYPGIWTEYTVTLSGVGIQNSGKLAFRYFVTNGGPGGDNSDYIGIDSFSYEPSAPLVPVSNWAVFSGIMLILTFIFFRFRKMI